MEINFVGGAYADYSSNLNAQVCQNLYPVLDQQGGKSVASLENIPGLVLIVNFETKALSNQTVVSLLRFAGSLKKHFAKILSGTFHLSGTLVRRLKMIKSLDASLKSSGTVTGIKN